MNDFLGLVFAVSGLWFLLGIFLWFMPITMGIVCLKNLFRNIKQHGAKYCDWKSTHGEGIIASIVWISFPVSIIPSVLALVLLVAINS